MPDKKLIWLCLFLLLLQACDKKLELPDGGTPKIVLLGELTAGDSIFLRAGQSTVIKSGASMNEELIQGLHISVADAFVVTSLTAAEDDISSSEHTLAYSSSQEIKSGTQYTVVATHTTLATATAQVNIPQPFLAGVTDISSVDFLGKPCIKVQLNIADQPEQNFYVIEVVQQPFTIEPAFLFDGKWYKQSEHWEVYDSLLNAGANPEERMDSFNIRIFNRIPMYTTDEQSEHLLNGSHAETARRVLIQDKTFNAGNHPSVVYIPKESLGLQFPGIGLRTLIQVKSISADYFHYLSSYEQADPFSDFSNTTSPVRLTGNVRNGAGLIGGVYKHQFSYFF